MNNKHFSVIGGDMRQLSLAKSLASDGFDVTVFALGDDIPSGCTKGADLISSVKNADYIILPLPVTSDDTTVSAPLAKDISIDLSELFKLVNEKQFVFGGKISNKTSSLMQQYRIQPNDYFLREEFAVLNAIPSAEGAVELAMSELPVTLHSSRCLVMGFGRIGKVLSHMLHGIGAKVTVCSKNLHDIAWADAYAYDGINITDMKDKISGFDVIFNTVPALIFERRILENVNKDTLIIDLASKPGGVDMRAAAELGLKTIWALGLPGKTAPVTAANIVKNTVLNMIHELGVSNI